MKKNKLALIGKSISHSKSQVMYEELLERSIEYTLLDYSSENSIEDINDLMEKYEGVSITAPYKKHFLNKVLVNDFCKKINAINCIRKKDNLIEGTNTDYLAVEEILKRKATDTNLKVLILGNGSMSLITQVILEQMSIPFEVISRSNNKNIESINLKEKFLDSENPLIINACSREFIFKGEIPSNATFWDYNYSFSQHEYIGGICESYEDGLEMLKLQAKYALAFWSIT